LPFAQTFSDYQNTLTPLSRLNGFLPQEPHEFQYYGWDSYKTRGCECDPQYGDVDCSKRMCQFGNDIMDQRDDLTTPVKYQTQMLTFMADAPSSQFNLDDRTFALTFKSKLNETFTTMPINYYSYSGGIGGTDGLHSFVLAVQEALEKLPNRVIDKVEVHGAVDSANFVHLNVTFVGENVQGPQNLLTVRSYLCGDGCTPKLSGLELKVTHQNITEIIESDYNSYECGRRGKCDYNTGLCSCFAGYSGLSCSTIACLV
jgi:hypothetical protein